MIFDASLSAHELALRCRLILPNLPLRLKPVLILLALAPDSLLVEFISPRGDLRS